MMTRSVVLPDGRTLDLDYFVEWRPWLWRKPVADALEFLGDLRGKRVLEIGGRTAKMSSLFALLGADVTLLEKAVPPSAEAEVRKWNVADRVQLVATTGGFQKIVGQLYDVIFTKSVLWSVLDLAGFLEQLRGHLVPGGKVAFVENYRGGKVHFWLRRNLIRRGRFGYEDQYFGITREQIPLFRKRFCRLIVRRYRHFVWSIFGRSEAD